MFRMAEEFVGACDLGAGLELKWKDGIETRAEPSGGSGLSLGFLEGPLPV